MSDKPLPARLAPEVSDMYVRDQPRHVQRRVVAATLARSTLYVGGLLLAYAISPTWERWDSVSVIRSLVGVLILLGMIAYQVVAVRRSAYPAMRAIEAVALVVPLILVLTSSSYLAFSTKDPEAFTESLDHIGAFYFSLTTLTTIGYGDISPRSNAARIVVMIQMVANVVVIGVFIRLIASAAQRRLRGEQLHRPG